MIRRKRNSLPMLLICASVMVFVGLVLGTILFLRSSSYSSISNRSVQFCEKEESCHETGLLYQDPTQPIDDRISDLMGRMTLTEKIGQMALVEKNSIQDPQDIAKYGLGALLSGAGAKPDPNTAEGWREMVDTFQHESRKTRLSIPLLYGVDAIHGHGNVPGATLFPHSIGLGATKDTNLVRDIAKATAEEVAATGINWVYSPNLDVPQDVRWGRVYETFGSDPKTIGALGEAYIEGLQSFDQNGLHVAASAKHFVGNGSSEWGSSTNKDFFIDQGKSMITEEELRSVHLEPFSQAVEADAKSIMVGLNQWEGEKISFNHHLLTETLKGEMGFQGFLVSDWYGVYEQESNKYQALVKAINAGIDMVMLPFDYELFSQDLHRAVANGDIREERVNNAVRRILKAKFEIGLFDRIIPSTTASGDQIGSPAHRELARMAVRKSLVLLKNSGEVPLSKKTGKIFVAGSAADNIGIQSGAWTVEWQGIDGNWIPGTSILKGIQNTISPTTDVAYDLKAQFPDQQGTADIGIAVVGERPYAEGWGDKLDPSLSPEDLQTITDLKKKSKKIVVIIISGRPLNISEHAKEWDAIIAAWLPGTEGQGVADVLFGDYPFTGTLPMKWDL